MNFCIDLVSFLAVSLLVIDWGQTRYIAHNLHKYYETNPILGKHPSVGRVDTYFTTVIAGYTLAYCTLPKRYMKSVSWFVIGLEAGTVARNYQLRIRIQF